MGWDRVEKVGRGRYSHLTLSLSPSHTPFSRLILALTLTLALALFHQPRFCFRDSDEDFLHKKLVA